MLITHLIFVRLGVPLPCWALSQGKTGPDIYVAHPQLNPIIPQPKAQGKMANVEDWKLHNKYLKMIIMKSRIKFTWA